MDPAIPELEALLRTMRHAGNALLNEDMWDRWGSRDATDAEHQEHAETVAEQSRIHADAAAELTALVAELRATSPTSVEAWADAHRRLLEEFIADNDGDEAQSTAVFVAREELAQWARVRDGDLAFVDENVFYVSINPERYRAAFGIDP